MHSWPRPCPAARRRFLLLAAALLQSALHPATVRSSSAVFDVTSFGAVGDGRTNSTAAVRAAALAVAAAGGGVLHFPRGDFLTGSFNMSSRSELRVAGRIMGIQPRSVATAAFDYPVVDSLPSYNDGRVYASL
eukprot:SAG22_NODE_7250_length_757_cov_1.948328_1_plen_132_part_01